MGVLREKCINALIHWLMADPPLKEFSLCDFERIKYELRPCDVILIEGRNRVSEVIKVVTQSAWSHAAIYIGRLHDIEDVALRKHIEENYHGNPESQLVVESYLGRGTIVSPIDLYKKDHMRICRPKGLSRKDSQQIISHVICRLGIEYDIRQIIDLLRYFFPWGLLPRRFRSSLFKKKPSIATKQICSTLIAEAFAKVNYPVLPLIKKNETGLQFIKRNPRLCVPSDFDYSPYFEIIKYPLFELTGQTIYRNLPWNTEGLVSNDDEGIYHEDHGAIQGVIEESDRNQLLKNTSSKLFSFDTLNAPATPDKQNYFPEKRLSETKQKPKTDGGES